MPAVVLYFHAHQPYRLSSHSVFEVGQISDHFGSDQTHFYSNRTVLKKVAEKCYRPANALLLELLNRHPSFKVSFSITGTLIEQLLAYEPDVVHQFQAMSATGRVEFLDETYYHSLASLFSKKEFFRQIALHTQLIEELFGQKPQSFRNTEFIYYDDLAHDIESMGYTTILAEGVDRYLNWRSPNFVYQPPNTSNLKLLLKNYRLSDDLAFRFSNRDWSGWPVTAEKFCYWLNAHNGNAQIINLFMDYETIGEHQWADTGIFDFFRQFPAEFLKHPDSSFMTVNQAAQSFPVMDAVSMPDVTSWADLERDVTAWLGNPFQVQSAQALYSLEHQIYATKNPELIRTWQYLTTSDHFYYMCTKWFSDGDVHKYFSPNRSPYEAYINFNNVLHDLREKLYAYTSQSAQASLATANYQLLSGIAAHDHRHSTPL